MPECKQCSEQFEIAQADHAFYTKINVPPPTHCPDCRRQRRFAFRNERVLYSRLCDLCRKTTISFYSPSYPGQVYCQDCWWSDKWDATAFGRPYEPGTSFFEQYQALNRAVPQIALFNTNSENAAFTAHSGYNKNCYMLISCGLSEGCYYGFQLFESRNVMDSTFARQSEIGYELIDCDKMYNSRYCYKAEGCVDSAFLYDCRGCSHCFMSANLRNKQYVFRNIQMSKEEYQKAVGEYRLGSFAVTEKLKKDFAQMVERGAVHCFANQIKCENVTGDHLLGSKNCFDCFDVRNGEDSTYVVVSPGGCRDSYDVNYCTPAELFYDVLSNIGEAMDQKFCQYSWASSRLEYCSYVMNSEDCFGSVGLRKNQYCILNKKYSKEEYGRLRERIVQDMRQRGEYGEFFPAALSPFGYNETIANDEWPMTREEVLAAGWRWGEEAAGMRGKETKQWDDVADDIADIDSTVCTEMFLCVECGRNYKIIKQEFAFYKQYGIPLPRRCFECRHMMRMRARNPRKLWERQCMCLAQEGGQDGHGHASGVRCANTFATTYAPERPEKVYCDECYRSTVC